MVQLRIFSVLFGPNFNTDWKFNRLSESPAYAVGLQKAESKVLGGVRRNAEH